MEWFFFVVLGRSGGGGGQSKVYLRSCNLDDFVVCFVLMRTFALLFVIFRLNVLYITV